MRNQEKLMKKTRKTWGVLKPYTRVIVPKKGKGSYKRKVRGEF